LPEEVGQRHRKVGQQDCIIWGSIPTKFHQNLIIKLTKLYGFEVFFFSVKNGSVTLKSRSRSLKVRTSTVLNLDVRYVLAIKSDVMLHTGRKKWLYALNALCRPQPKSGIVPFKKKCRESNSGAIGLPNGERPELECRRGEDCHADDVGLVWREEGVSTVGCGDGCPPPNWGQDWESAVPLPQKRIDFASHKANFGAN